jgi:ubiquinone/menaquinone biosynthesis C-methylase UbiE
LTIHTDAASAGAAAGSAAGARATDSRFAYVRRWRRAVGCVLRAARQDHDRQPEQQSCRFHGENLLIGFAVEMGPRLQYGIDRRQWRLRQSERLMQTAEHPAIGGQTTHRGTTKYDRAEIARSYHNSRYGDFAGRLNLWAMKRALSRALRYLPAEARILDAPCGTGQYSWYLAGKGFRVTACDIAPAMIVAARDQANGAALPVNFLAVNAFALPFAPGQFDAAVCIRFFNLLKREERIAALRSLARVSKTIVASYNHPHSLKHFSRRFRHWCGLRDKLPHRAGREVLDAEVAEAGLKVSRLTLVAPPFSETWLALLVPATTHLGSRLAS